MPIPVPSSTKDIGECIRFLRRDKPEMKNEQMVAICLDLARKNKKPNPVSDMNVMMNQ